MQTFLPYPDYDRSAQCLDRQRLGKQRVEALQILRTLTGDSAGWKNHPAVRMWAGHEQALAEYGVAVCEEWIYRGYRDTCLTHFKIVCGDLLKRPPRPWWHGDDRLHASHRSNLLRKLPAHYGGFEWSEPSDLPYWWPNQAKET